MAESPRAHHEPANVPITLASRIEPDGGMPGNSIDQRIERTIASILFFEREGRTEKSGPFRAHKMIQATLSPKRERGGRSWQSSSCPR